MTVKAKKKQSVGANVLNNIQNETHPIEHCTKTKRFIDPVFPNRLTPLS